MSSSCKPKKWWRNGKFLEGILEVIRALDGILEVGRSWG